MIASKSISKFEHEESERRFSSYLRQKRQDMDVHVAAEFHANWDPSNVRYLYIYCNLLTNYFVELRSTTTKYNLRPTRFRSAKFLWPVHL